MLIHSPNSHSSLLKSSRDTGFEGLVTVRRKGPEREVFHCKSPDPPRPAGVQARMVITERNVRVSEDSSGVTILKLEIPIM